MPFTRFDIQTRFESLQSAQVALQRCPILTTKQSIKSIGYSPRFIRFVIGFVFSCPFIWGQNLFLSKIFADGEYCFSQDLCPQVALHSRLWAQYLFGHNIMVRVTGLEPVRQRHTPLKRACLPIPAHSQITQFKQHIYYITLFIICPELFNFFYHLKSFIINASDRENSGRACLREFSCTINFSSAASVTGIFSAYACY